MKVAIITHFNQRSPFAEVSAKFASALTSRGHEVTIVSFAADEAVPMLPNVADGPDVLRFSTDKENWEMEVYEALKILDIQVLVVNRECFPDDRKLEVLVKKFTSATNRSYLICHNDNHDSKFQYHLFTGVLLPSHEYGRPPGSAKVAYLQQGIPEFQVLEDRVTYRRTSGFLPAVEKLPEDGDLIQEGYVLATFAGKTNLELICPVLEYINQYQLTQKPVYLLVQDGSGSLPEYVDLVNKYKWLLPSVGYLPPNDVAKMFQAADGFICVYPETPYRYTSSALRFAFGCSIPTITNSGNHCRDIQATVIADSLTPESIKHAIVTLFSNYGRYSITAKRMSSIMMKDMSWPAIVEQFEKMLPFQSPVKN